MSRQGDEITVLMQLPDHQDLYLVYILPLSCLSFIEIHYRAIARVLLAVSRA